MFSGPFTSPLYCYPFGEEVKHEDDLLCICDIEVFVDCYIVFALIDKTICAVLVSTVVRRKLNMKLLSMGLMDMLWFSYDVLVSWVYLV